LVLDYWAGLLFTYVRRLRSVKCSKNQRKNDNKRRRFCNENQQV